MLVDFLNIDIAVSSAPPSLSLAISMFVQLANAVGYTRTATDKEDIQLNVWFVLNLDVVPNVQLYPPSFFIEELYVTLVAVPSELPVSSVASLFI
jgi:hypothetical protein